MTENLVQHRSGQSVWDQRDTLDTERWLTAIAAGACLVVGLRRRSAAGLYLALAGAALAWWAAGDIEERRIRRAAVSGRWQKRIEKRVDEALEDSFPASDPLALAPSDHVDR